MIMEQETNNEQESVNKGLQDTANEKAEDNFKDATNKEQQGSGFFKKAHEFLDKAEVFVDNKVADLEKSGIKEKIKTFTDKVEDKTDDLVKKAKIVGKNLADTAEDLAEKLKNIDKEKGTTPPPPDGNKAS
jgi:hypothetical protein